MIKNKELEAILETIDLRDDAPADEPMSQYYFIKKAREREAGQTFDCRRGDVWVSDERQGQRKADRYS